MNHDFAGAGETAQGQEVTYDITVWTGKQDEAVRHTKLPFPFTSLWMMFVCESSV